MDLIIVVVEVILQKMDNSVWLFASLAQQIEIHDMAWKFENSKFDLKFLVAVCLEAKAFFRKLYASISKLFCVWH